MKALLATLLAAALLLVFSAGATAMPNRSGSSGSSSTAVAANPSNGGTDWYVYALVGIGGVIVVGGAAYVIVHTTHRHGPHRPVGAH